jgi:hypothetical protein
MEDKVGLKPTGDSISVRVRVPPRAQKNPELKFGVKFFEKILLF